jgi:hypothetical protein
MGTSAERIELTLSTIRWQDVPKIDNRPVAYIAAGSHGVWSYPGRHVYANVGPTRLFSTLH